MRWIGDWIENRYLVRPPRSFDPVTVQLLGTSPSLRRAQDDHWPAWPLRRHSGRRVPRLLLDRSNLEHAVFHHTGHFLVHQRRVIAFYHVRRPAIPGEETLQFLRRNPRQNRWIRDLVTIEVQHRQHCAVVDGIQELVRVPRRRQRSGLRFAIPHNYRHDQIRIVECRAESMRKAIPQFPTLVDGARRLGCAVTPDSTRKRELLEELLHAGGILAHLRINLRIHSLEVAVCERCWSSMARP